MKVPAYKSEKKRGEVTAFLALIFVLLVGFTGSMMESASLQSAKSYRRADMNCDMESVFEEYQRDIQEESASHSLRSSIDVYNSQIVRRRNSFCICRL